ncbi:MAG: 1,4-dihydroxy-2-naphthoate polyprenyltransferase [Kiritimatiellae bacterium]|nr:1,4-dihydroxy-2-naphthoate polyprenyltransferase [Kiritimatiellia bacterium]
MNIKRTQLSSSAIWIIACRPKTLWAAFSPVLIGTAIAYSDGFVHLLSASVALLFAVFIQIGTNFCNDVADFKKGADTKERKGPLRATQAGLVSPQTMIWATSLAFGIAFLFCLYLIYRAGWPIAIIGIFSILFGILYTAGPFPLGYHGLGDLFVLVFFGPVAVVTTYYVQALEINWIVILAGFPPGFLSVAILVVNNLRDREEDAKVGKKTWAVRFGKTFARLEYVTCIGGAVIIPVFLVFRLSERMYALTTILILILALPAIRKMFNATSGTVLNPLLGYTAKLLLLYSVLFAMGWNL